MDGEYNCGVCISSFIPICNVEMCGCNKAKAAAVRSTALPRGITQIVAATSFSVVATIETVDTSVWGASLWKVLHIAAQRSTSRNIAPQWRIVLDAMKTGLPCPDCSKHYNAWYKSHPFRIGLMPNSFHGAIMRWVLDLHNDVNRRTGKPIWGIPQLSAAYNGETMETAKALAESLNGIIGPNLSSALSALLRAL